MVQAGQGYIVRLSQETKDLGPLVSLLLFPQERVVHAR